MTRQYHKSRILKKQNESEKKETSEAEELEEMKLPSESISLEEQVKLVESLNLTKNQLKKLNDEFNDTKVKLMSSYAERENIRRTAQKDIENAKEFGIKAFAVKMFDLIDTVDLCLSNLPKEYYDNPHLESAIFALDSVRKQFLKVMSEYHVSPIEVQIGDKFDSNIHHAVFELPPSEPHHEPHSVAVVVKGGWSRKGNLLRASQVGVFGKKS